MCVNGTVYGINDFSKSAAKLKKTAESILA